MKLINLLEKDYVGTVNDMADSYIEGWPTEKDMIDSMNKKDFIEWIYQIDMDEAYFEGTDTDTLDCFADKVIDCCREKIMQKRKRSQ